MAGSGGFRAGNQWAAADRLACVPPFNDAIGAVSETATATGALTTDSAEVTYASDPTGVTGYRATLLSTEPTQSYRVWVLL